MPTPSTNITVVVSLPSSLVQRMVGAGQGFNDESLTGLIASGLDSLSPTVADTPPVGKLQPPAPKHIMANKVAAPRTLPQKDTRGTQRRREDLRVAPKAPISTPPAPTTLGKKGRVYTAGYHAAHRVERLIAHLSHSPMNDISKRAAAQQFQALRAELHLTQAALAEKLSVGVNVIALAESRQIDHGSPDVIKGLKRAFGL